MDAVLASLSGLDNFALYFLLGLGLMLLFKTAYVLVTPYDEWRLIKEQQNLAAAISLAGALVGFSIALSGAAANSVSLIDFLIWALVGLIAQLLAFAIVRFLLLPKLIERIERNEISAAVVLAGVNVAVGLFNAACMSY